MIKDGDPIANKFDILNGHAFDNFSEEMDIDKLFEEIDEYKVAVLLYLDDPTEHRKNDLLSEFWDLSTMHDRLMYRKGIERAEQRNVAFRKYPQTLQRFQDGYYKQG